jgi:hypothetical protein
MLPYNILIQPTLVQFNSFIDELNICLGLPDGQTITWQAEPLNICLFDLETGQKTNLGYGVIINEECYECLTQTQKDEVMTPQSTINLCSWEPPLVSGQTENYFTQFFSGQTNN